MGSKKYTEDMLWTEWTDELGNTYRPGDIVAIATISGRSPQLVYAVVERINKVNSSGEPHMINKSFKLDEPVRHERECHVVKRRNSGDRYYDRYYAEQDSRHICKPECTEYWQVEETRKVPSCSVTAKPVIDARGFGRYSINQDGEAKSVTYTIPANVVLVERRT